jgi:hypothetical protein
MAKRAAAPAPEPEPEPVALSAAEVDIAMSRRRLDSEVDLANRRAKVGGKESTLNQPAFRYGPTEPPGGVDPNHGKVPPEIEAALERALDLGILNAPLGLVFTTAERNVLYYLDQVHGGEFVLRPYWKKV